LKMISRVYFQQQASINYEANVENFAITSSFKCLRRYGAMTPFLKILMKFVRCQNRKFLQEVSKFKEYL